MSYLEFNNVILTLDLKLILSIVVCILWFQVATSKKLVAFMRENNRKSKLIFSLPYLLFTLPVVVLLGLLGGFSTIGLQIFAKIYQWSFSKLAGILDKK